MMPTSLSRGNTLGAVPEIGETDPSYREILKIYNAIAGLRSDLTAIAYSGSNYNQRDRPAVPIETTLEQGYLFCKCYSSSLSAGMGVTVWYDSGLGYWRIKKAYISNPSNPAYTTSPYNTAQFGGFVLESGNSGDWLPVRIQSGPVPHFSGLIPGNYYYMTNTLTGPDSNGIYEGTGILSNMGSFNAGYAIGRAYSSKVLMLL
jgi:hypothetical protein